MHAHVRIHNPRNNFVENKSETKQNIVIFSGIFMDDNDSGG